MSVVATDDDRALAKLPEDTLDLLQGAIRHAHDISDVWKNSYPASTNAKVWAARVAARHPNLVAIELSNFKCGHDAPVYATIEALVERSGTPCFAF